jgi:UDP-2,3-diacylglucosamine hydrolase
LIYVIGDSHIGLGEGAERRINSWMDRFAQLTPRPQALYLNGDLFHYLIAHKNFRTPAVDKVFAKFKEVRDRGTAVHYVEGNRDFFLRGSFVEDFVSDVAYEFTVAAADRKYLIIHGDMINDRDWQYRFWRVASKNVFTKIGTRFIPKGMAIKTVNKVERQLAKSNFKHKYSLPLELMKAYGDKRSREGFTDVVFGHFHEKLILPATRSTIRVLPAWYESGEALRIDPNTGDSEYVVI